MMLHVHRLVWGCGSKGYEVLARSAGAARELLDLALDDVDRWALPEQGVARGLTTLKVGDGHCLCAFKSRVVAPGGGKRSYREHALLAVDDGPAPGAAEVSLSQIFAALPDFSERGELAALPAWPELPPEWQPTKSDHHDLPAVWGELILRRTVIVPSGSEEGMADLLDRLWALLPDDVRRDLVIGVGILSPPRLDGRPCLLCGEEIEAPDGTVRLAVERSGARGGGKGSPASELAAYLLHTVLPGVDAQQGGPTQRVAFLEFSREAARRVLKRDAGMLRAEDFVRLAHVKSLVEQTMLAETWESPGPWLSRMFACSAEEHELFLRQLQPHLDSLDAVKKRTLARRFLGVAKDQRESSSPLIAASATLYFQADFAEASSAGLVAGPLRNHYLMPAQTPSLDGATMNALVAYHILAARLLDRLAEDGNPHVAELLRMPVADSAPPSRKGILTRIFSRDSKTPKKSHADVLEESLLQAVPAPPGASPPPAGSGGAALAEMQFQDIERLSQALGAQGIDHTLRALCTFAQAVPVDSRLATAVTALLRHVKAEPQSGDLRDAHRRF